MDILVERLISIKKEKGISYKYLAQEIGFSQDTIYNYTRYKRHLMGNNREKVETFLRKFMEE